MIQTSVILFTAGIVFYLVFDLAIQIINLSRLKEQIYSQAKIVGSDWEAHATVESCHGDILVQVNFNNGRNICIKWSSDLTISYREEMRILQAVIEKAIKQRKVVF